MKKEFLAVIAVGATIACSSDSNPGYMAYPGAGGSAGSGGASAITDASTHSDVSSGAGGASSMRCPFSNFSITADGGCVCAPGTDKTCPVPGRDGGMIQACVDSMTDAANCGACGTACEATAACIAGKCGKAPTALVAAASGCTAIRLVFDGGKIYWTDQGHGTVKSVTPAGAASSLSTGEMAPTSLVVRGGDVYWVNSGNKTIRALASGSTTPTTLVATAPSSPDGGLGPESEGIHGIALSPDGNTVYFSAGTDVYKVPKAGGAVVNVGYSEGPRHGIPSALAIDAKNAYYPTDSSGNVEILSLTTMCDTAAATAADPTCPLRQARSQSPLLLDAIFVRGDNVYWAKGATVRVGSVSAKQDAGLGGADGDDYASAVNAGNVTGFALGTANAYFGEFPAGGGQPEEGLIEKAGNPPYAKGMTPNATVIARKQPMPTSLAVDGTNVYWTTSNCDIEMIADTPQ